MKTIYRLLAGLAVLILAACATPTETKDKDDDVTPPKTDFYLFSTAGTADLSSTNDDWGSGTAIDRAHAGDSTYSPAIQLTSGKGWGDVSAIGFNNISPAGVLGQYTTLKFKVKATGYTTIMVKFPASSLAAKEKKYTIADGKALAGGWTEMTIPFSDFETMGSLENQVGIFEFGAGSMLITDVGFSGTAPVTNAGLLAAVTAAQALLDGTTVGAADGNVPQAAHDAFASAIATASAAPVATWTQVIAALTALEEAKSTFVDSKISFIPTTLAPAPTLAASSVIALYDSSATYTPISGITWNPNWGQGGSIADFTVAGKTVKHMNLVNYQGVDFASNVQDITGKSTLHISYWTQNGTALKVYAINVGDTNPGVDAGTIVHGAWTDLEIPVTGSLTNIQQLKFDSGVGNFYLDNIYFH